MYLRSDINWIHTSSSRFGILVDDWCWRKDHATTNKLLNVCCHAKERKNSIWFIKKCLQLRR